MTDAEVAALEPGIYLLRYLNGAADLAAVGEMIGAPGRWYMSCSTIVSRSAARVGAVGPWVDWDHVRSASLVISMRDVDELEAGDPVAALGRELALARRPEPVVKTTPMQRRSSGRRAEDREAEPEYCGTCDQVHILESPARHDNGCSGRYPGLAPRAEDHESDCRCETCKVHA